MRRLGLAAIALTALGCSLEPPFDRTNPFDPGSPYVISFLGAPDTVASIGERFQVTLDRDPPIDQSELSIQWQVSDPNDILVTPVELQHLFNGEYIGTNLMSAQLRTLAIGARFNSAVVVGRNITVGQLVATLNPSCGATACSAVPVGVGGTLTVFTDARDALNQVVRLEQFAMQRATVTVRSPSVLTPTWTPNGSGTYTFSVTGTGTTWVVIRSDRAVDSVQVTIAP
jgi:hypothetical protein